jgi:hypothetical protein
MVGTLVRTLYREDARRTKLAVNAVSIPITRLRQRRRAKPLNIVNRKNGLNRIRRPAV